MNLLHQEIMLDLFTRMADYIDSGMDPDTALAVAAEDMRQALRAVVTNAAAAAFQEANIKLH